MATSGNFYISAVGNALSYLTAKIWWSYQIVLESHDKALRLYLAILLQPVINQLKAPLGPVAGGISE